MEAFSLLKYWRGGGNGGPVTGDSNATTKTITESTNIVSVVDDQSEELSESEEEGNADDGPFFDMEFTVREEDGEESKSGGIDSIEDIVCVQEDEREKDSDECDCENERELKFTLSSASSGDSNIDPNISLSPSDDLFFKGRLVPLSEPNCKPVSPLKSATKLRVLMLKLKKSTKLNVAKTVESEKNVVENQKKQLEKEEIKRQSKSSAKFFTVNFKADEVPMLSLFTRENSSKLANTKTQKQNIQKSSTVEEEKVFSKDVMNKYLKKVKPLYVRVSKRYGEKLGFSGHLSLSGATTLTSPSPPASQKSLPASQKSPPSTASSTESPKLSNSTPRRNVKNQKSVSFPAKLRVVRKRLGKSKSASSTVTSAADSPPVTMASKRRDDSLLQQQDGIQSAIMHCKRSFKASREMEGAGVMPSVNSHPKNEKSVNVAAADLSCSVDKSEAAN